MSACSNLPIVGDLLSNDNSSEEVEESEEEKEIQETNEEEDDTSLVDTTSQKEDTVEAEGTEEEDIDNEEVLNEEEVTEEEAIESNTSEDDGQCAETFDVTPFTDEVEDGFYLPTCAELTDFYKSDQELNGYFYVKDGIAKDIFAEAKEFADNRLKTEKQNISGGVYELWMTDHIEFRIEQDDEGAYLRVKQYIKD